MAVVGCVCVCVCMVSVWRGFGERLGKSGSRSLSSLVAQLPGVVGDRRQDGVRAFGERPGRLESGTLVLLVLLDGCVAGFVGGRRQDGGTCVRGAYG